MLHGTVRRTGGISKTRMENAVSGGMSFELTEDQELIRKSVRELASKFDDGYWMDKDLAHEFPREFYDAIASGGWLGMTIPEEYGGHGLGITEATHPGRGGRAVRWCDERRQRHPPVDLRHAAGGGVRLRGDEGGHAATDRRRVAARVLRRHRTRCRTGHLAHHHVRQAGRRHLRRQRPQGVDLQGARVGEDPAARPAPRPTTTSRKKTDGLSLFLTDLDRDHVDIRPIKKMGRNAVSSNELFIDDLRIPVEDRIGEEGKGFQYILHGLNPERMLIAAEALGIGRVALDRAVKYANERVVFGRPIGMNQGIQFPLADSLARLDAAELILRKATWLYDNGKPCGREANMAKYLCADAGFAAADRALQTHGGMGYSEEYNISRFFRESRLMKIAPVSQEMILNFLAANVLGLPKSY